MPAAHRNDDLRFCLATTVVKGQTTVFVNNKLWAVEDDPNTHLLGGLIPSYTGVYVEGKPVIVNTPDLAKIDGSGHAGIADSTNQGSGDVNAYD